MNRTLLIGCLTTLYLLLKKCGDEGELSRGNKSWMTPSTPLLAVPFKKQCRYVMRNM